MTKTATSARRPAQPIPLPAGTKLRNKRQIPQMRESVNSVNIVNVVNMFQWPQLGLRIAARSGCIHDDRSRLQCVSGVLPLVGCRHPCVSGERNTRFVDFGRYLCDCGPEAHQFGAEGTHAMPSTPFVSRMDSSSFQSLRFRISIVPPWGSSHRRVCRLAPVRILRGWVKREHPEYQMFL